jgi:parallel beta-helix repeat protein
MRTAMQMSIRTLLFNIVPVLLIARIGNATDVEAATYYVSTSGSNANSCSTATSPGTTAKRNVAQGLACLSPGDTLRIQAGTYTTADDRISTFRNPFPGGSAGAPTIIECETSLACTLAPNDGIPGTVTNQFLVAQFNTINYVTVRNLKLDATCTQIVVSKIDPDAGHITLSGNELLGGIYQDILVAGATNAQILNNNIHDTCHTSPPPAPNCQQGNASPCGYGIYASGNPTNLLFEGNTVHHIDLWGFHGYCEAALCVAGNNIIIRNNTFHDNSVAGPGTEDVIVYQTGTSIYNNVFYNTPTGGIKTCNGDNQIYNNTFYNESLGINLRGSGNTVRNNLAISSGIVDNGSGNIVSNNVTSGTASSIFTNASGGDFTLKAGSIPIDAGQTISTLKTDHAGMPRPYGSAYDIGAYEFQGSAVTSVTPPSNLRIVP